MGTNPVREEGKPMKESKNYLPAAGRDWLLPLYDPFVKLLGIDSARKTLIAQSDLQPGHRVLDIGCGTGTFIIQIKHLYSNVEIAGLDPDPKALSRAKRKIERDDFVIQLDRGFSENLPYPDASFDRVFSSFMFHHLETDGKQRTLQEVRRVLKPGGSLHLLDFGHSETQHNHKGSFLSRWIHSSNPLKNNSEEQILSLISQNGFANPRRISHRDTFFSRIVYYQAYSP